MFDEMFLHKSQEFVGGIMVGCNENEKLFKAVFWFVKAGLRENVHIVVHRYVNLLAEEIKVTIRQINVAGLNVSIFI